MNTRLSDRSGSNSAVNIRASYRDLFRAAETVRAAIFAAKANCSRVACRSALSSSLSIAML